MLCLKAHLSWRTSNQALGTMGSSICGPLSPKPQCLRTRFPGKFQFLKVHCFTSLRAAKGQTEHFPFCLEAVGLPHRTPWSHSNSSSRLLKPQFRGNPRTIHFLDFLFWAQTQAGFVPNFMEKLAAVKMELLCWGCSSGQKAHTAHTG